VFVRARTGMSPVACPFPSNPRLHIYVRGILAERVLSFPYHLYLPHTHVRESVSMASPCLLQHLRDRDGAGHRPRRDAADLGVVAARGHVEPEFLAVSIFGGGEDGGGGEGAAGPGHADERGG